MPMSSGDRAIADVSTSNAVGQSRQVNVKLVQKVLGIQDQALMGATAGF